MSDINLIPPYRLARNRRKRRLRVWILACVTYGTVLCTALLAAHLEEPHEDGSLEDEYVSVQQSIEERSAEVTELKRKLAGVQYELQITQSIHTQPDWSMLFVLLGSAMDDNIILTECSLVTTDLQAVEITNNLKTWLSSSPIETLLATRRYRLGITGFARTQNSISKFVLELEQTKVFESVRLIKSCRQVLLDGQAIAFSIDCWI